MSFLRNGNPVRHRYIRCYWIPSFDGMMKLKRFQIFSDRLLRRNDTQLQREPVHLIKLSSLIY